MTPKQLNNDTYQFPHWSKIAKTYSKAVQIRLDEVKASRSLYNYREGQIDEKHLKETKEKVAGMKKVTKKGIVTIKIQLGEKWKGKSVEYVRQNYAKGEIGLGAYELLSILLANPKILRNYEDLWIDCPGDKFDSSASDVRFDRAPCLDFVDQLGFDTGPVSRQAQHFGSASWFLPQSKLDTGKLETIESLSLPNFLTINGIRYKKDE